MYEKVFASEEETGSGDQITEAGSVVDIQIQPAGVTREEISQ